MYDLRSRPGIHQKHSSKQGRRPENSKASVSDKGDHSSDNEESENEECNEDTAKQYYGKIYPNLSELDFIDRNEKKSLKLKRKATEEKPTKKLEGSNENSIFSGITKPMIFIIVVVMILILFYFSTMYSANKCQCETPMCLFQEHFKHLRATFVSQGNLSWKVIGAAVISVVNNTAHTQPAVILLIANKKAKAVSSCIANSLASSVEMSYRGSGNYPKIQNEQHNSSNRMKEIIYRTFKENFEKGNHHAIVLEDLDTFKADAAMTLHLFCDHENAPYKNIVIILTAVIEDFSEDMDFKLRDMHSIAENHLNKAWKSELWEEKRAALLARITGSVAVIRSEKSVPSACYK